jgi:predicted DsbA family dithiol-disulfide isomerase
MKHRITIPVIITSDFICPWCFIAERRLNEVAKKVGVNLDISYKPFELNPTMPIGGKDRKLYRSRKFGSVEQSHQLDLGTIEASKDDPLTFDYDRITKTPNTRLAHQVVQFVQLHVPELEANIVDVLFEAYFSLGKDIGDKTTLLNIAEAINIDKDKLSYFLSTNSHAAELNTAIEDALTSRTRGVPSIDFKNGHSSETLYGAQQFSVMETLLTNLMKDSLTNPQTKLLVASKGSTNSQ